MDTDTVEIELSVSDCHSLLSVLKTVIKEGKENEETETDVIETLTLLYDDINGQLGDHEGEQHAQGLYSTTNDS